MLAMVVNARCTHHNSTARHDNWTGAGENSKMNFGSGSDVIAVVVVVAGQWQWQWQW